MGTMDTNNSSSLDGRVNYNNQGGQIFTTNSGTLPTTLMGNFAGGTTASGTGFKVAKPGFDVRTATDSQLIFNSNYNTFKIVATGTASVAVADPFTTGSVASATIAHNLGFQPVFLAYVQIPTGDGSLVSQGTLTTVPSSLMPKTGSFAGITSVAITASTDSTNLYLRVTNTFGANLTGLGSPYTFRYYLLQETAN